MPIQWFTAATVGELGLLALAFLLSAVVGLERTRKLKSAGLRTHTLVGLGAAVFTLVSAHGFGGEGDPTRIAAQIVSGIGFLGAGVIFVRRNAVAGLTTAASIWVVAAIGMACGAGLPVIALAATALHLLAVTLLGPLGRWLQRPDRDREVVLRYRDGHGALRACLAIGLEHGLEIMLVGTQNVVGGAGKRPRVRATLRIVEARADQTARLLEAWTGVTGVVSAHLSAEDDDAD